jgi:hypothetical protein
MIQDKNLIFVKRADTPATTTRAIPMGQNDLGGDTSGMGPYQNLYLVVMAGASGSAALTITLEHSDTEAGTYTTLATYTTEATYAVGEYLVKEPVSFRAKNWLRVKLSAAEAVDAFLVYGVDKGVETND